MIGGGDSDHSRGGKDEGGGDLTGLLLPPTLCGSNLLEATDSPTGLLTDHGYAGCDALQLVPLLPVRRVGGEQLPLPELCLSVGGGGKVVRLAGAFHDVEPIWGGLGCMSVARPVHHLLLLLRAGLELLLKLLA